MDVIELTPFGPSFNESLRPVLVTTTTTTTSTTYTTCDSTISQDQSLKFFTAGVTAAFTASLYNGLDCLRVRWQIAAASSAAATSSPPTSMAQFSSQIVRNEGFFNGLWRPGIAANAIGMGVSGALRFGYYESMRDALHKNTHSDIEHEKNAFYMAFAGLTCGATAYFLTAPFHLLKTMIQAEKSVIGRDGTYLTGSRAGKTPYVTSLWSGMKRVVADQGILGLWRGSVPLTARGATFTAGQLVGYDGFKTVCKSHWGVDDGPALHAVAGIFAAFSATVTATPADYTMSRYMALNDRTVGVTDVVRQIYREGGVIGFWRGSGINFCRSAPVFLTYTAVYEELRRYFGLGYFS